MSVPSDGGGKAREWTLLGEQIAPARPGGGCGPPEPITIVVGRSPLDVGDRVVVIEKEWADRQLAEALDVLAQVVETHPTRPGAPCGWPSAEAVLRRHGRLPDDS